MDPQLYAAPILTYPEPSEFDYSAFLNTGDDLSYQHVHSQMQLLPPGRPAQLSPVGPGPGPNFSDESVGRATTPSSDTRSNSNELVSINRGKQRLERRGHTKSRRGCYNCKRRRIKCQETHPACGHCVKTGLKCEYPSLPQITHQPHHQIPLFSLQDMRFFQHFLTQCYPHHPLKQEEVWTHEVPCIAHNHDFLMHAILGFAASELIPSDPSLVAAAMNHRVKAIRSIKKRLVENARTGTSHEEANALVATCFALTFQSVTLDDGMAEYMTFIRGIVIVSMQMLFRGIKPIFSNLMEQDSDQVLAPFMQDLPLIQRGWADSARDAIENLRALCVEPVEIEYQEKLSTIVDKLYVNSWAAYKANSQQYGWWMMLPHNIFQELISQDNQVMLLLHTHWISLSQIMVFITQQEYEVSGKPHPKDEPLDPGFHRWLHYLNARIDYEHQMYNQWPLWVDEQLERDITFFGKRI